eukprot:4797883-Pleurochrysis_carterae.AAC.1
MKYASIDRGCRRTGSHPGATIHTWTAYAPYRTAPTAQVRDALAGRMNPRPDGPPAGRSRGHGSDR